MSGQSEHQQPLLSQAQDVERNTRHQATSRLQRFRRDLVEDTKEKSFIPQVLGEFVGQILFNYMLQTILISVNVSDPKPINALFYSSLYITIFFTLLYLILQPITGMIVNPSITLNFLFIGRLPFVRACLIVTAQFAGAVVGSGFVRLSYPKQGPLFLGANDVPSGSTRLNAFVGETIGTFIFNLAIVAYLDSDYGLHPKIASFAIGGTLGLLVFIIGPISGASLNPARSFGPALVSLYFHNLWIYIMGPVLGGLIAGQVYIRVLKY